MTKDYVTQEVLDTISLKQLNGETIDLSNDRIEAIVESIIFEWNEIGDPEEDFSQLVTWNIDQNLTHG